VIGTTRSRAAVGLLALAAVVGVIALDDRSSGEDRPTAAPRSAATDTTVPVGSVDPRPEPPELPDRGVHPELRDIDGWLQSDVTSLEELRGQVVAVQFWTFGCRNCKATLPHMRALYDQYRSEGFEIVGVHAPEFDDEADVDNIAEAAAELGVTWPIALDTTKRTFHHWQEGPRAFWPRLYLLDRDGHVRYDHHGEGRYDEIDAAVQALLDEPA
jgi:thiol-disulfide isomerase/thioredoxin